MRASIDLVMLDIKHPDPAAHRRHTGVDNAPILRHLAYLKAHEKPFIARVPLIPGVNDAMGTAEQTASDRSVCWFGAYAPAEDPKYVVFSNVDGGSGGGATAMLVVRDVFGQIYGQPDTSTVPVAGID